MIYDIIIVGGGPAGLTAAVYAKRANKSVLVIEKGTFGGQITFSPKVENIPGFTTVSGNEFAEKLVDQVLFQGADTEFAEVTKIEDGKIKKVYTDDGGVFESKAVIVATGAKHRTIGVPSEEQFIGDGISFCAVCDGAFYADKTVAVIGGGNSALQEALLLLDVVKKLYVVQNLDYLTGEAKLAEQLKASPKVEIIYGTVVDEFLGDGALTGIKIKKLADGNMTHLEVDGVFIAIGLIPQNERFKDVLPLNKYGYVETPDTCETTTPGIFVAGDCRSKRTRQVTTAVGDGANAALSACDYVDKFE